MWTIWQNKHISKSISPHKSRFGERLFTQSLNAGIVLDFFEEKANELSKLKINKMNRESSHHKYTTKTPNSNHNINFKIGNANQIEPNLQRINYKMSSNNNSGSSRGIFININNYNSNKK